MTRASTRILLAVAAALLMTTVGTLGPELELGTRSADAVVGRPLTPMSYAGVARRTTRRGRRRPGEARGAKGGD
jgi:hypothetical protein